MIINKRSTIIKRLNYGNPIARGIFCAVLAEPNTRQLVDYSYKIPFNTVTGVTGGDFGSFDQYLGYKSSVNKQFVSDKSASALGLSSLSAITIVAILGSLDTSFGYIFTSNNAALNFSRDSIGNQNRVLFERRFSTTNFKVKGPSQSLSPSSQAKFIAISCPNFNTYADSFVFINGVFSAPDTGSQDSVGTLTSYATSTLNIGGLGSGSNAFGGYISLLLAFNRSLTQNEIASLYRNPYQLFYNHEPLFYGKSVGGLVISLGSSISIDHIIDSSCRLTKNSICDISTDTTIDSNCFLTKNLLCGISNDHIINGNCNLVKNLQTAIITDTVIDGNCSIGKSLSCIVSTDTIIGSILDRTINLGSSISDDTIVNNITINLTKNLYIGMSTDTILSVSFVSETFVSCDIILDTILGGNITKGINLNSILSIDTILNINAIKTHTIIAEISSDTITNSIISLVKNLYTNISIDTILTGAFSPQPSEYIMLYSIVVNVSSELSLSVFK